MTRGTACTARESARKRLARLALSVCVLALSAVPSTAQTVQGRVV